MTAWKQVLILDNGEPLVPVGPFSDYPRILSSAIYAGEREDSPYMPDGLPGSILTPFVRSGVAERLDAVGRALPDDHYLLIWDSYRSIETQASLYEYFDAKLRADHPDWSDEEITTEAQRFVSLPSRDPAKPSPHNTGGVVDLTIVRLGGEDATTMRRALSEIERGAELGDWQLIYRETMAVMHLTRTASIPLPMGTDFDEVSPRTLPDYFSAHPPSTAEEQVMAANQELLRSSMRAGGFHPYSEEWWHFSYGDQMWGLAHDCPAIYGAAELSVANQWFEREVRRAHHRRQRDWFDGREPGKAAASAPPDSPLGFAREIAFQFSDPRFSIHPLAHKL